MVEISRWEIGEKRGARAPFRVYRRAKPPGKPPISQTPRNFLFQFAINKSTTHLVNRLRLATALSKVRLSSGQGGRRGGGGEEGRTWKAGRTRQGEGGRRKRRCNSVELKELKDASLLVSFDSPSRGKEREKELKKKEGG